MTPKFWETTTNFLEASPHLGVARGRPALGILTADGEGSPTGSILQATVKEGLGFRV